jgi:hypothetical protein
MPAHRVATAGGQSVEVTPIVVEARDLVASTDRGYDPALQPRQRDRAASQQQVREIASRLDPERLGVSSEADRGAPIIGDDGMVESGNGRVMAIRAAYRENAESHMLWRWIALLVIGVALWIVTYSRKVLSSPIWVRVMPPFHFRSWVLRPMLANGKISFPLPSVVNPSMTTCE